MNFLFQSTGNIFIGKWFGIEIRDIHGLVLLLARPVAEVSEQRLQIGWYVWKYLFISLLHNQIQYINQGELDSNLIK